MKIAVDIDGTLLWSNVPVFLEECNKTFELGISSEILNSLTSKEDFYALPVVATRLLEEEYFCYELAWIEFRERCLLESLVMDDAAAGVARLASLGDVTYYTARYSHEHEVLLEIKKASKQWLKQNDFINYSKVVFCDRIKGKVLKILKLAKNDNILLVDDSYISILEQIEQLKDADKDLLLEKLMIVALRAAADELPSTDLKLVALPYWDEIDSIMERIHVHGRQTKTTKTTKNATSANAICARYSAAASR
jgi:uncharacterized HAD superfamily protein